MKKFTKFVIAGVCLIAVGVGMFFATNDRTPNNYDLVGNWTNQQQSFEEAVQNSTQVVYAKVVDKESFWFNGIVFTEAEIEILENFKGVLQQGDKCFVRFTGGVIDGEEHYMERQIIPEISEEYIFALEEFSMLDGVVEGKYVLVGGYQGMFKMENGIIGRMLSQDSEQKKVVELNDENVLEKELLGKSLSEIRELVEQ